jgi:hypothetical protein
MRFVTIMSWKPENAKEITERYKQWTPPEGITYISLMGDGEGMVASILSPPRLPSTGLRSLSP